MSTSTQPKTAASRREKWQICARRKRRDTAPVRVYVSINPRGEIAMNAAAFREIDEPASVTLMYEPTKRRIGVKFPVTADKNFFRVRRYGRGRRMRIVRAARLLKQFGIEIERTLIFTNAETVTFRGSPMLVLPLDEGIVSDRVSGKTR
ncbi:MAG: hypothetical protein ABI791_15035 [Acidobacteriota bacterium]